MCVGKVEKKFFFDLVLRLNFTLGTKVPFLDSSEDLFPAFLSLKLFKTVYVPLFPKIFCNCSRVPQFKLATFPSSPGGALWMCVTIWKDYIPCQNYRMYR